MPALAKQRQRARIFFVHFMLQFSTAGRCGLKPLTFSTQTRTVIKTLDQSNRLIDSIKK